MTLLVIEWADYSAGGRECVNIRSCRRKSLKNFFISTRLVLQVYKFWRNLLFRVQKWSNFIFFSEFSTSVFEIFERRRLQCFSTSWRLQMMKNCGKVGSELLKRIRWSANFFLYNFQFPRSLWIQRNIKFGFKNVLDITNRLNIISDNVLKIELFHYFNFN